MLDLASSRLGAWISQLPAAVGLSPKEFRRQWIKAPRNRQMVILTTFVAAIWWVGSGLHQSLWSWRYWKVDPWHLAGPVQWPLAGRHAQRLESELKTLAPCLPRDGLVALDAPQSWQGQRFYLFMWMAFLLPEQRVMPIDDPSARRRADILVSFHGDDPPLPTPVEFTPLVDCDTPWLRIYQPAEPTL